MNAELVRYAELGARLRLEAIDAERARLTAAFPDLISDEPPTLEDGARVIVRVLREFGPLPLSAIHAKARALGYQHGPSSVARTLRDLRQQQVVAMDGERAGATWRVR